MEFENNQNNIEQVNQTPESENNSKVEKIDMSIVEYERKKDEFYAYTQELLNDSNLIRQCNEYLRYREEEKNNKKN